MDLPDKKIILFDGVCNLCNGFVQLVIKYDKKDIFRFVALQSPLGQKIISSLRIENSNIDSVILYNPVEKQFWIKSNAAVEIMRNLNGIFRFAFILKIFPRFFRNLVYDIVAKYRYKLLGKRESCMIPTLELKNKFL